jgi:hypothetical protein
MRLTRVMLGLLLAGFSMLALAGAKSHYPVTVCESDSCGYAWGTMRDARNAVPHETIYCEIGDGAPAIIDCRAVDGAGRLVRCAASAQTSPGFADVVRSINSTSFVYFSFAVSGGPVKPCTDILVVNGSEYMDSDVSAPGGHYNNTSTVIGANFARGSLSSASRHANPNEFVRCGSWGSGLVTCTVQNEVGQSVSCQTNALIDPAFAASARSIDATSFVEFGFDPATRACTRIKINKGSIHLP